MGVLDLKKLDSKPPFIMFSEGTKKRLRQIAQVTSMTSQFTEDELLYIHRAIVLSDKGTYAENVKGSGDSVPAPLAAPVEQVQACRSKKWIQVMCHHGNTTWKPIRCRWCDGCAHNWKARVRAIILDGCDSSRAFMWTLTMKEYPDEVEGDIFDLAQSRWHSLLRDCSKRGFSFEYLRVVELQKRGTPHFHMACKDFVRNGLPISETDVIARTLRGFAKRAGFGYRKGKTTDFQAARLGGAGVASYMSKYLSKTEGFNKLRRDDGRAIRRYCRSRGWSNPRPLPTWRYTVTGAFSRTHKSEKDVICICGEGKILRRHNQAQAWVAKSRLEGKWVGPLDAATYLMEGGAEGA